MQSLEVISINIWSILISFANLAILFCLLKKFLYKPVKKVIETRQSQLDEQYAAAAEAEAVANASREAYEAKLATAHAQADDIIHDATVHANRRGEKIVTDARVKAEEIVHQGELQAEMELKKAQESIRREITDVSAAMTEQLLRREMNTGDHRQLIDEFLKGVGED